MIQFSTLIYSIFFICSKKKNHSKLWLSNCLRCVLIVGIGYSFRIESCLRYVHHQIWKSFFSYDETSSKSRNVIPYPSIQPEEVVIWDWNTPWKITILKIRTRVFLELFCLATPLVSYVDIWLHPLNHWFLTRGPWTTKWSLERVLGVHGGHNG